MLIYRGKQVPGPLTGFTNIVHKQTIEKRYFMVTKDKSIFDEAVQSANELEWMEGDGYEVAETDHDLIPENVARSHIVSGQTCKLGEHNWMIPTLRAFPVGTSLPANLKWNLDGTEAVVVQKEYLDACVLGDTISEWFSEGQDPTLNQLAEWFHGLLSVNYQVTLNDVRIHGLVPYNQQDAWLKPLMIAIDGDTIVKFQSMDDEQKKRFLESCSLSPDASSLLLPLANGD